MSPLDYQTSVVKVWENFKKLINAALLTNNKHFDYDVFLLSNKTVALE